MSKISDRQSHWERAYHQKAAQAVSWYRPHLDVSLQLMGRAGLDSRSRVIDVGAGASTLIDDLLALGVRSIIALDLSAQSLAATRERLAARGDCVQWMVADATSAMLPVSSIDIWHDRATLHFLTDPNDVRRYVDVATNAVAPGGYAIVGSFAADGPTQCSGFPVTRRDPEEIAALFASHFVLTESRREIHRTPSGNEQSFAYALLQRT
ncbi:class I SAM-dependent methyltransferase [Peristeroidobacter agariperforans]|uniref:class I SAM-dependent methyltransferase n=1 Tax=Peristeroidobacter agariperforans TaxID=268404 RepID=UPI00101D71E6|nr:class I SAM-dependent methyltransferase [Peristeroidobacter agariperforans]